MWFACAEFTFELVEFGEETAHSHIRVDAFVEAAAMRGAADRFDLKPDETFVREADFHLGRLSDDGAIDLDVFDHFGSTDAGIFFVGHSSQHHIAVQSCFRIDQRFERGHARGHTAFHVVRAAPVKFAIADRGRERIAHAVNAHNINVPVEHDRLAAAFAFERRDHAGTPRRGFDDFHAEAESFQVVGNICRNGGFARRTRHEIGVDRVNADEISESGEEVVAIYIH